MLAKYQRDRDFPYLALDLSAYQSFDGAVFEFLAETAAKLRDQKIGDLVVFDLSDNAEAYLSTRVDLNLISVRSVTEGLFKEAR